MVRAQVTIVNKLGLHARAAARFVTLASRYQSHIELIRGKKRVSGKSIMGIMMLAASQGTELEIVAEGTDEEDAIKALTHLVELRFDEGS